jgi:membrane-associated phospholipid phosphatase
MSGSVSAALDWRDVLHVFQRPQSFTWPMGVLFVIMPGYLLMPALFGDRTLHAPEIWLDRALPRLSEWSFVYGSLFCVALLPAFVVQDEGLLDRTIKAYLAAWLVSFAFFFAYPTIAPAHPKVTGSGFADWGMRAIYAADVKYNCFPSLHVAQSFIAALACYHVHRGVGKAALAWASLVGVSTLLTKQHYVLDVVTGAALGYCAYRAFILGFPRERIPVLVKRAAPMLAAGAFLTYGLIVGIFWALYASGFSPG